MTTKKVTSKNTNKKKQHYRRGTFKLAECISMMDVLENKPENVGLLLYVADRAMEVREREIARCERITKSQ